MKVSLILVFLFQCTLAAAQYNSIFFNNVSLNEGLSQSCVVDIAFDAKGLIWMATQDGLNRYDGKNFLVIDKKFDDITSGTSSRLGKIVSTGDHFLWCIAKGGRLEKFDFSNNTFLPVNIFSRKNREVIVCFFPEKNGKIWVGTESGKLIYYDSHAAKVILEIDVPASTVQPAINAFFKDSHQRLWVIGSTLGYIENNKFHNSSFEKLKSTKTPVYSCMAEDKEGNFWLGSWGSGLFIKKKRKLISSNLKAIKLEFFHLI